jgi:hypothetical protein
VKAKKLTRRLKWLERLAETAERRAEEASAQAGGLETADAESLVRTVRLELQRLVRKVKKGRKKGATPPKK